MVNTQSDQNKGRALESALKHIEKQFGVGSIMSLGDHSAKISGDLCISTGCMSLDYALGNGIPRGRIVEIYGPESSGKSTIALHIVANCQKNGGVAAYIDAEHALDPTYASILGVKTDDILVSQPGSGEEALNIADVLASSNAVSVIVVDSVAALVPKAELEGEIGDIHMGLQARLMSQALRKLTATTSKSRTAIIFINQVRDKIGVVFGNPETTTGGRALKFYASIRIKVSGSKNSLGTGIRVKAKVVKNKISAPFRSAEFDIQFNEGISRHMEIIDLGINYGILDKNGSWYSYKNTKIGQGKESIKEWIMENEETAREIESKIIECLPSHPKAKNMNKNTEAEKSVSVSQ